MPFEKYFKAKDYLLSNYSKPSYYLVRDVADRYDLTEEEHNQLQQYFNN